MPDSYDAARGYSPAVMQLWLDVLSEHIPRDQVARILDLGCGTGRFSAALAELFGATVTGLDPSEMMLARARRKHAGNTSLTFLAGSAEAVPLATSAADLVFMSMVHHHLREPEAMARECRRILHPGGRVFLRTATAEQIESEPAYRFFPGLHETLTARLPPSAAVRALFQAAGFAVQAQGVIVQPLAAAWRDYARKLALRTDSFLATLPDESFEAGMAALRAHAEQCDPGDSVTANVEYFVFSTGLS